MPPSASTWSTVWECDLAPDDHADLAGLLALAFPHSTRLAGRRSWSRGRPELRVIGRRDGRVVAHLAVLRRFLRGAADGLSAGGLLVADVGLVAVHPEEHGRGVGRALLGATAAVLDGLDVPFGFLTTSEALTGFYAGAGWRRVRNRVRQLTPSGEVVTPPDVAMVLPVRADPADWSAGTVDRNGYEV